MIELYTTMWWALLRRWWYLFRIGINRGEVSIDYYRENRLWEIRSGDQFASPLDDKERIWWQRPLA
jgi:hypothetical protein